MFYNHEILTSRKHGVATVWLIATLGAKSTLKKVNRKDILEVNVPKACETIITPEVPMALRLQGNLLFGVSRVYSQQCNFMLADAEGVLSNMKNLYKIAKRTALDPNAGDIRPDLLLLDNDPAFMPAMIPSLNVDIAALNLETISQNLFSLNDPSIHSEISTRDLDLSIPEGGIDVGAFELPGLGPSPRESSAHILEDIDGIIPDVGFQFDAEGNLVETPTVTTREYTPQIEVPFSGDDTESVSEHGEAALARTRAFYAIDVDDTLQLPSHDISHWAHEYLDRMANENNDKKIKKDHFRARDNADFWVFGIGIGAVGSGSDLRMFSGDELKEALTPGNKRKRSAEELDDESRESKRRSNELDFDMDIETELGRGAETGATALEEFSSQMPWNMTPSIRGSRAPSSVRDGPAMTVGGFPSTISATNNSVATIPGSFDRRASRLAASPLLGYGTQNHQNEFELLEASSIVADEECSNFLDFVKTAVQNRNEEIDFQQLLPPDQNSKIVATHAFLHVLTLATANLLRISKKADYADIRICLI